MPLGLADPLGQTGVTENHQLSDGFFIAGLECVFLKLILGVIVEAKGSELALRDRYLCEVVS